MLKILWQAALLILLASPSFAQDWVVTRVRGSAEQLTRGRWIELVRGATVLDEQSIRTGADGRVGLARGAETIELDPGTLILLHEGEGKMTSIEQASGAIAVDVERRNVQHFSVQTPFLAAVVKGTKFSVSVSATTAEVDVLRGTVQVQDTLNDLVVDIVRGQQAQVSRADPLLISGAGTVAIFTFDGLRVVNGTIDTPADNAGMAIDPAAADAGTSSPLQTTATSATATASGSANAAVTASGNGLSSLGNPGNSGNGKSESADNPGSSNAGGSGTGNNGNGNSNSHNSGHNGNGNSKAENSGNADGSSGNSHSGGSSAGGDDKGNNGNSEGNSGNGHSNGNGKNNNGNGGDDGKAGNGKSGGNGNKGGNSNSNDDDDDGDDNNDDDNDDHEDED